MSAVNVVVVTRDSEDCPQDVVGTFRADIPYAQGVEILRTMPREILDLEIVYVETGRLASYVL